MKVPLYDAFSQDYDRFVDWAGRLEFEMPFFRALFRQHGVRRMLDVACGTGQHAIAFAREGLTVAAADLSQAMVERARANVAAAGVEVTVRRAGFGQLAETFRHPFDAITCLGNSLPHLTSEAELVSGLGDMAALLVPGGVLVIQNRNMDRVLMRGERFMPPQVHREGDEEWIFFRFYDMDGAQLDFNVLRLHRPPKGTWQIEYEQTSLRAWQSSELIQALRNVGLEILGQYGSYRGEPFDRAESGDWIGVARRPPP
ncbi:MAG: class I SAM-dependent methyltransferase [Chloroflexi bacterium]|nr:class I SAM-dependent methyltransferase [Chloroflexota bacterium]